MKKLASLFLLPTICYAQDIPVGALISRPVPKNFMIADGSCLADKDYPELSHTLSDKRCDKLHFKLLNLRCKQCEFMIRTK